jgi:hypothetical protein
VTGLRTKPFALFALLALAGGTVVLPVLHQASHSHAHSHGEAEALVFDAENEAHGPHGGLLLHPKPSKKHSHAPLSHGRNSVEHYGVAVALSAAPVVTIAAPPAIDSQLDVPRTVLLDTSYLCSPLQPGAPPRA